MHTLIQSKMKGGGAASEVGYDVCVPACACACARVRACVRMRFKQKTAMYLNATFSLFHRGGQSIIISSEQTVVPEGQRARERGARLSLDPRTRASPGPPARTAAGPGPED